jgi:hypothetical protein
MTPIGYLTRDAFGRDYRSTAVMVCYVLLYFILCYVMLCYVILFYAVILFYVMLCHVVRDFCPQMTQLCAIDEGYVLTNVYAHCFLLHCFSISEWLSDLKFLVIFSNSFGSFS